jgi:hypothetical protein
MKTNNKIVMGILSIFAIYGIIILIQKIRFDSSKVDERVKKGAGYKYWIEPFRRADYTSFCKSNCPQVNCNDPGQAYGCWLYN